MSIVTLSRGSKVGGQKLAEMLAAEIQCHNIISREVLVKVSEEYGVTEKTLIEAMDKPPKIWERSVGNPRHLYLIYIRAALLDYAAQGCLVYHGNAGHFLLGDISWVLKVRLIAPLEQRITLLQKTMEIDRYNAEQHIHKIDDERARWTKFLYGEDWRDPHNFDMVLNLRSLSFTTACQSIINMLDADEFKQTNQRDAEIANKALAARVQASLAAHPKTASIDIDVSAESGSITLSGLLHSNATHDNILAVTKEVRGVLSVNNMMRV
ncbi:MAG: cytidylate kinase family protein [bacterium]